MTGPTNVIRVLAGGRCQAKLQLEEPAGQFLLFQDDCGRCVVDSDHAEYSPVGSLPVGWPSIKFNAPVNHVVICLCSAVIPVGAPVAAGVVYNDLNGDGRRQNVVGGKNNERGIPNVQLSVYVHVRLSLAPSLSAVMMALMGYPLTHHHAPLSRCLSLPL